MGYIESDNGRAPVRPSKASRMTVWQRPHCMSDTELSHCIRERALAESVGCGAVGHGVDAGGVPQHTFAVEREKAAVVGTIEHGTNNPRNQGATGAADMLRSAGRSVESCRGAYAASDDAEGANCTVPFTVSAIEQL